MDPFLKILAAFTVSGAALAVAAIAFPGAIPAILLIAFAIAGFLLVPTYAIKNSRALKRFT